MERLTIPDKKVDRRLEIAMIDVREVEKYALYWALKKYEDTGLTPEEIEKLKERQTPKKPDRVEDSGIRYTDEYRCPNCGRSFTGTGIADYCYHCGQAIDWSK